MNQLQDKLNFLLDKYDVISQVVLNSDTEASVDGVNVPLLAHRYQRRFIELKNIVQGGTLEGVSVMRSSCITTKGKDLYHELYRELDLCQFILGRSIRSLMSMENECVLNTIATTEDGVVCTIEIAATLPEDKESKDKHEIISQRGIACDIVVDAQLRQDSLYVLGSQENAYTDVDFELFGLSVEQIAVVRSAFAVAREKNIDEIRDVDDRLCRLVELARRSARNVEREVL